MLHAYENHGYISKKCSTQSRHNFQRATTITCPTVSQLATLFHTTVFMVNVCFVDEIKKVALY